MKDIAKDVLKEWKQDSVDFLKEHEEMKSVEKEEHLQFQQAVDYALSCIDERDIAVQQLDDLGYELGEEVKPKDHKTVKELRVECEEYLDRDLSLEKRCDTIKKMTPKEWLEEIIYSYGNGITKLNRLYICSDLFILLQKIEKEENEK